MHGKKMSRGFTLIELLVVVAIIAVLISILLPALASAREQGRKAVCLSNIHQFGMGFTQYATDFNRYPPIFVYPATWPAPPDFWMLNGAYFETWETILIRSKFVPAPVNFSGTEESKRLMKDEIWRCPTQQHPYVGNYWLPVPPFRHYAVNSLFYPFDPNNPNPPFGMPVSQIERPATTLLIGEVDPMWRYVYPGVSPWSNKPRIFDNPLTWRHSSGRSSNVLFFDGHVSAYDSNTRELWLGSDAWWDFRKN